MSIALGVLALLVALASVVYARRSVGQATRSATAAEASAGYAKRSADAAEATVHAQNKPLLHVKLNGGSGEQVPAIYYSVRNDGPQDLDEVIVSRPQTTDGITYQIGHRGQVAVPEELNLGALALNAQATFALHCGAAAALPDFRVVITCRKGETRWQLTQLLPPVPRNR